MVVIIGEAIMAGSRCKVFARMGMEQPRNLAIRTVQIKLNPVTMPKMTFP